MATTISPATGHAALITQAGTGASPGFDAIDFRRLANGSLQEGVMMPTSYEVTQRGAGANMSVDIAANAAPASNGVAAYIEGDSVTGQGLYPVPAHTAVINEVVTTAHATLPRVDRVVLTIQDHTHDASGQNRQQVLLVDGTATAGATLDNLNGAAAVPVNCLLLADVHVPAADTTISNSQIRDRRKWARGAYCRIVRNANAAAGNDYTLANTNIALLDATNLVPRIECSGVPIRVTFAGSFRAEGGTASVYFSPQVDSAGVNGMASVGVVGTDASLQHRIDTGATNSVPMYSFVITPTAGSHIIAPGFAASVSGTLLRARAATPAVWIVEEVIRQNTANNATTTG